MCSYFQCMLFYPLLRLNVKPSFVYEIATAAGLRRTNRDMELSRAKDDNENKELLQKMLQDVETLKEILSNPGVGDIAQTIRKVCTCTPATL